MDFIVLNSIEAEILYILRVRMHYGHPDVFDRVFHITRGGISKASRVINISEDIYSGMVMLICSFSLSVFSCQEIQLLSNWFDS